MKTYIDKEIEYYKQNNYPKPHSEELPVRMNPVHEQLEELEYAVEKLTELQSNLIKRLEWVSNPCERLTPDFCGETKANSERPDSEIVQRIKRSVRIINELQFNLSIQLEDLDV